MYELYVNDESVYVRERIERVHTIEFQKRKENVLLLSKYSRTVPVVNG